jgi:hypothetical protein
MLRTSKHYYLGFRVVGAWLGGRLSLVVKAW